MLQIILLLAAALAEAWLQQALVALSLLAANIWFWRRLTVPSRRMRLLGLALTLLLAGLVYVQALNAVSLGYADGILYGAVSEYHAYYDMSEYFYEAAYLRQALADPGGRQLWLSGGFPYFGTYGPYNSFNIWNAALMFLYGEDLISLTLVKLHFSVASLYLLYQLARRYAGERGALYATALYHLYPGYLLTASTFLRDNMIACLMIYLTGAIAGSRRGQERLTWLEIANLIIAAALLLALRNYAFLILGAVMIGYYAWAGGGTAGKGIWLIIALCLAGVGIFIAASAQFAELFLEDGLHIWEGAAAPGLARMLLRVVYFSFLGQLAVPEQFFLPSVAELLNLASYFYLHIILISALAALLCLRLSQPANSSERFVTVFGYLMPTAFLALLTFVFGWPIPRLYNMWLWMTVLVVVRFYRSLANGRRSLLACGLACGITFFYLIQVSPWMNVLRLGAVLK